MGTYPSPEVFKATDFLAAAIEHIPPQGQHTIRYYGLYSNKSLGIARPAAALVSPPPEKPAEEAPPEQIPLIPAPPKTSARAMRPLWRDLILSVWGIVVLTLAGFMSGKFNVSLGAATAGVGLVALGIFLVGIGAFCRIVIPHASKKV